MIHYFGAHCRGSATGTQAEQSDMPLVLKSYAIQTSKNPIPCLFPSSHQPVLKTNPFCPFLSSTTHHLCSPPSTSTRTIGAFFQCGQVVPIIRGNGIFQPAVNESIRLLQQGKWVHVFPEGKVNQSSELIRLKWGIGRILLELAGHPVTQTTPTTTSSESHTTDNNNSNNSNSNSNTNDTNNDNDGRTWAQIRDGMPIVVPIYHFGMDDILRLYPDNSSPIFPKLGLPLTIVFGEPIDFSRVMTAYKEGAMGEVEARIQVTATVHAALEQLRAVAQTLHEDRVHMEDKQARNQSVQNLERALSWIKPVGWGW